ncbi:MAG TPA: pentapeptide repeat-containing protein, partial [Candidatus Binatia bacterium]|nr:pentapeptide repeat-containing protein [Candidatus Binatia bacterium]
ANPRLAFRATAMNCEFVPQWGALDLTRAVISACVTLGIFTKQNFAGADMAFVDFKGSDLTGINLSGADLTGAILAKTTLAQANLSHSKLYGAHLNHANLVGANLQGAFLTFSADVNSAADLTGAYLKNVNLAGADLTSAILDDASFYGTLSTPAGKTCVIDSDGFTDNCASASGATLTNTSFQGTYLYGVDFGGGAKIEGTDFYQAVVIGANFSGAQFTPVQGHDADFSKAFIQGTTFPDGLTGTKFEDAFVDFSQEGNTMWLKLDASHANFPGWKTPNQPVCVQVSYGGPTVVPPHNQTLTCPDESVASGNTPPGCGPLAARNKHWASPGNLATGPPPAAYKYDSTYVPAAPPVCGPPDTDW